MSTTERITLPSGNWIQLRDAKTLRRGDKKRAISSVTDTDRVVKMAYEMTDGLLAVLVIDWSYELPLPSKSLESLDLLPVEDDDALMKAIEPARLLIFPEQPNPADPKQREDPASPTEPSAA
ncbi:hypothetical protein ACH4UM_19070 [Streptomyces sp. NPDC020801]|uniref:hypothetical protein n=1 Tax=Streptomyces sp. NPDC020801 TaxID=3365093 RepID=UPI0037ACC31F